VLKTGDTLNVHVTRSSDTYIEYTYPNETLINQKNKREISYILYASGRREDILTNVVEIPVITNKNDWEKVIITRNREDITGLTMVKNIAVSAGGGLFHTISSSQEMAIKLIKKKAAKLKCGIVLITSEGTGGLYAGMNGITMTGEAYKK
jgi:hypothetical protein